MMGGADQWCTVTIQLIAAGPNVAYILGYRTHFVPSRCIFCYQAQDIEGGQFGKIGYTYLTSKSMLSTLWTF